MLICVDGTGKILNVDYAVSMAGSFVGMIYYRSHLPNREYYRGPDFSGVGPNMTQPLGLAMRILEFWLKGDREIFMTGYSRGAAIVIDTANVLCLLPMPGGTRVTIEAMFLFDAVDRSVDLSAMTQFIPPNVHFCYHAIRDDSTGSRSSFGHCGMATLGARTVFAAKRFYTTHGGMGGQPWGAKGVDIEKESKAFVLRKAAGPLVPGAAEYNRTQLAQIKSEGHIYETFPDGLTNVTVAQEKEGSDKVRNWMWPFLRHHRVL